MPVQNRTRSFDFFFKHTTVRDLICSDGISSGCGVRRNCCIASRHSQFFVDVGGGPDRGVVKFPFPQPLIHSDGVFRQLLSWYAVEVLEYI